MSVEGHEDRIVGRDRLGRPIWKRYYETPLPGGEGVEVKSRVVLDTPGGEERVGFLGPEESSIVYVQSDIDPDNPEVAQKALEDMLVFNGWPPESWKMWGPYPWVDTEIDGKPIKVRTLVCVVDTGATIEKYATVKRDA